MLLCTVPLLCCRPAQWLSSVVQFVGFAEPLKYLLVVLKPGFSGQQLAAMTPDIPAMADVISSSEITGVIVATGAPSGTIQG